MGRRSSKKSKKPPKLINLRTLAKEIVESIDKHPLLKKRLIRPWLRSGTTYTTFKTFCWAPRMDRWDDKFFTVPSFERIRELTGYEEEKQQDDKSQDGAGTSSLEEGKKEKSEISTEVGQEKAESTCEKDTWNCVICTFENPIASLECGMCNKGEQPSRAKRRRSSALERARKRQKIDNLQEESSDDGKSLDFWKILPPRRTPASE